MSLPPVPDTVFFYFTYGSVYWVCWCLLPSACSPSTQTQENLPPMTHKTSSALAICHWRSSASPKKRHPVLLVESFSVLYYFPVRTYHTPWMDTGVTEGLGLLRSTTSSFVFTTLSPKHVTKFPSTAAAHPSNRSRELLLTTLSHTQCPKHTYFGLLLGGCQSRTWGACNLHHCQLFTQGSWPDGVESTEEDKKHDPHSAREPVSVHGSNHPPSNYLASGSTCWVTASSQSRVQQDFITNKIYGWNVINIQERQNGVGTTEHWEMSAFIC